MKTRKRFFVSVWMITYNHEKYIAQAIESVISQKTTFEFELVIGEDYSSDETRAICLNYARQFPDKIRVLSHPRNVGVHQNIVSTLQACTGEYVALLEGDDYWTDPLKLQKQVDFLVENPDFVMCYQKTLEINELTGEEKVTNNGDNHVTGLEEILARGWFMRTGSLVFKNRLIKTFPTWFYQYDSTDYMLHILIAQHGKVGFLNEATSVYRRHSGGITQSFQKRIVEFNARKLKLLDIVNAHFCFHYDPFIKIHKRNLYNASFIQLIKDAGNVSDVLSLLGLFLKVDHFYVLKRIVGFFVSPKTHAK